MIDTCVVRLPTWLGDVLMALPVVRAVERSCSRTVLMGSPHYRDLLQATGFTGEYMPYRRRPGAAGISDAIHAVADLRHVDADAILLLPNAFEAALLAAAAGIPRRYGYGTDGRRRLLTEVVPEDKPRHLVHEADRFARVAYHAGIEVAGIQDFAIDWPDDGDGSANVADGPSNGSAPLPPGRDYVGIVAGSANDPAKRWPPSHFALLIDRMHDQWGLHPVLLGSEADRAINHEIDALCETRTIDVSGGSVVDLAGVMSRCRLVVANDTGGAHLAAALGLPTGVLFGPTDPARSRPRADHVVVLSAQCFCRPCGYRTCPLDHACMAGLAPDAVLAGLAPLWETTAAGSL